jgi:hypothetical protein
MKKGSGYKLTWNGRHTFKKPITYQSKFEGRCTELKGFINDYSDLRQADMFTKTTKEFVVYVRSNYKYGNNTKWVIKTAHKASLEDATTTGSRR